MPIARSTLTGAATGVVLLAGAVGFGVGLPEIIEDPEATSAVQVPELPDRIDDRFVALSAVTAEDAGVTDPAEAEQIAAVAKGAGEGEAEASSRLAAMYDGAVVRSYLDAPAMVAADGQSAPAQFSITVVPGDAGLIMTSGPFNISQSGASYELKEVGGYPCALTWNEAVDPTTGVPTGAELTASNYRQVECRAERDGLSYDIYSTGMLPEEVVSYLELTLELTAESD